MSYESRTMIVLSYNDEIKGSLVEILSSINLSSIEDKIINVFDKEVDFRLYDVVNTDEFYPYDVDRYGKKLKYCTLDELYSVLMDFKSENRRVDILKRTLEAIKLGHFDNEKIYIVHYGY